jgi:hypothetical protein
MATMDKKSWKYVGSTALTGGEALKWSAQGQVDLATAVTDKPVGWAAEACAAGNVVPQNIAVWPINGGPATVQGIASAAITAGDKLSVTAGGKMITAVPKATLAESEEYIWGYANEGAGVANEVIEIVVLCYQTSIT